MGKAADVETQVTLVALIQVIEFDRKLDRSNIFAWRFPNDKLGNWSQLIVYEAQEAVLFRDGQALDLFGPGRYTLSSNNIPMLSGLLGLPAGGESPFRASVWFVNTLHVLDVKWGTATPLQLRDPEFKVPVPVRAHGQFGVRISNSRKFLLKLVGSHDVLDRQSLTSSFRGLIMNRIGDLIASYLVRKKINIFELSAYLGEMADESRERLAPVFDDYGIELLNFYVGSVNVPEDDPAVADLRSAMSERARMNVVGYNYNQMRSFDAMEKLASSGGGNQLLGAGLGLGVGVGMGGPFGTAAAQMANNMNVNTNSAYVCPQCGKACSTGDRFCSACGKPLTLLCPKCGAPVEQSARFCPSCGAPLQRTCECGAAVPSGALFCPNCGKKIMQTDNDIQK